MSEPDCLLGIDIGSSSIKASVIRSDNGKLVGSAVSPKEEMSMESRHPGWAEQHPDMWWEHVAKATRELISDHGVAPASVKAIGLSYQMHGLVAVDRSKNVLRPSIIWCDSRAGEIGRKAFDDLGRAFCLEHYLNSPGNFTASKLKWVRENEPDLYGRIHKVMLPGDYIGMKMTGRINTTVSGLSEGIMWDYQKEAPADELLDYYGISRELLPDADSCFEVHGELTRDAATELGLNAGTPVAYRAGDQPNNAFSLNVLQPGESAATAGTSGVIYGITDRPDYDPQSRVNTFVHVNHLPEKHRYGVLLCINGTGILNSWLRRMIGAGKPVSYEEMNELASQAPIGSDTLSFIPFGNGSERILEDRDLGARLNGLQFNRHDTTHLLRAAQEGIVFSLNYGFEIMKAMNLDIQTVKAGHSNMFLSSLFREAFVNATGTSLELYNTDGAQGAARGAGVGAGIYSGPDEAFEGLRVIDHLEPDPAKQEQYQEGYHHWLNTLQDALKE